MVHREIKRDVKIRDRYIVLCGSLANGHSLATTIWRRKPICYAGQYCIQESAQATNKCTINCGMILEFVEESDCIKDYVGWRLRVEGRCIKGREV